MNGDYCSRNFLFLSFNLHDKSVDFIFICFFPFFFSSDILFTHENEFYVFSFLQDFFGLFFIVYSREKEKAEHCLNTTVQVYSTINAC